MLPLLCMLQLNAPSATGTTTQKVDAIEDASSSASLESFDRSFFDAHQALNAYEMLRQIPGFTFNANVDVRGLGAAAGNVLINGAQPVAKDDRLDQVLTRIPPGSVSRIELIRGGAPGIDMHGLPVVANVILKKVSERSLDLSATAVSSRRPNAGGVLELKAASRSIQ